MSARVLFFLIVVMFFACKESNTSDSNKIGSTSNDYMVDILKNIYQNGDPTKAYNLNSKMAEIHKQNANIAQNNDERSRLIFQYGNELLNSGKTEDAIAIFDSFIAVVKQNNVPINENIKSLYDKLAIAYLRLGEQQNCINNHTSSSCIIPLKKEGYHQLKTGSEKAIETYSEILELFPNDYSSMWLLNIAYMTLGKYPQDVPKQWYIPIPSYKEDKDLPYFNDIASNLGLDVQGLSGGIAIEDFNNDGNLDLFMTAYGLNEQCRLFFSNGKFGYDDVTKSAGLTGLVSGLNVIHADYNNDGFQDIFVLRGGWLNLGGNIPNSLLKNNGDGTFTDVTQSAGLLSYHPTQTASWTDYDLDGWLDLYIGNESIVNSGSIHPNEFFRNNRDGTFTDVASIYNLNITEFCKGVNFGDINNDGLPDLYVSIMGGQNKLFINKGGTDYKNWKFEESAKNYGVESPFFSFPNIMFDYNNDGNLDLLVFGYSSNRLISLAEDTALEYLGKSSQGEKPRLFKNLGNGKFEDVTMKSGFNTSVFAMGCAVGDINNDGFEDVFAGTGAPDFRTIVPNRFFKNENGNLFSDNSNAGFGHIQKGHGIGLGDLDNDGDMEIYCVQGGAFEGDVAYNLLYENPIQNTNWITISLEGTKSNKSAIGAKVHVQGVDSKGQIVNIYRWVGAGGTFGSSSLQLEVGLGDIKKIDKISIDWPTKSNHSQIINDVPLNKSIKITEGQKSFQVKNQQKFTFVAKNHKHMHH